MLLSLNLFRRTELNSDSKSQLALFIINEMKATNSLDWINLVQEVDYPVQ
jgi:hypothetical protein